MKYYFNIFVEIDQKNLQKVFDHGFSLSTVCKPKGSDWTFTNFAHY